MIPQDGDTTRSKHVVNNNNTCMTTSPSTCRYSRADWSTAAIYDVKFYPYTNPDEDAVFAAVAAREVSPQAEICRRPC